MTFNRLLTTAAAVSLLAGLAPMAAQAQTAQTATTEKAAAAATGKASTDAPAATAVQGTAKAVAQSGVNAQATAPAAAPAGAAGGKLTASGDITATLRQSPDFTTLVKALDATNLASLLQRQPGLTVFAPTNAAFAALPAGKLDALMADKAGLQKLLLHHVINAPVPGSKIKGSRGPVPSGAGDPIVIDGSADVLKADNANIIQSDVAASNGTVHVVDQVLMAGSVPAALPETAAAPDAQAAAAEAPATVKPKAPAKKN
jgi:uncharacterized surface protein with fasciclin (FAS1) repeats